MTARILALGCLALTLGAARPAAADQGAASAEPASTPGLLPAPLPAPPDPAPSSPPLLPAPAAPVAAPAAPPERFWRERPLAIEGQLAVAGPLGGAGVALDASLTDWFAVNAGVGVGRAAGNSEPLDRMQLALTPRLRLPFGHEPGARMAVGIETGLSTGAYKEVFGCLMFSEATCVQQAWKRVLWVNTNLVIEMRRENIQVRGFAGLGTPVAAEPTSNCERARDGQVQRET